jgi:threonine dehydrogenase-like Zn-dependent dehydrogenase
MPQATAPSRPTGLKGAKRTMIAAVFAGPGRIELVEKPVPRVGPTDALMRVTTTTICGTDVGVVATGRADLTPLLTHRFCLEQIAEAYELFGNQRDGVLKVAITP